MVLVQKELKNAYIGEYVPPIPYLCFTAEEANSTIQLVKTGSPTAVTLETSTDGNTRSTYTFGDTITLSNIGDKVYFRNTSETTTGFSTSTARYQFGGSGNVSASGDITALLCKFGTDTLIGEYCFYSLFNGCSILYNADFKMPATGLTNYCYYCMFRNCTNLITAPSLPATILANGCYGLMFYGCSNLEQIPKLPATTLYSGCYSNMFNGCSKIKLSTTQTGIYQTAYRIPTTGTGGGGDTYSLNAMFDSTGGTFTGTPSINTTYYTSNTVV